MVAISETELSDELSRSVAALIREELARRRISRQRLADDAKISLSTLEKALSGRRPFTLATTIRLEEALGVPLRRENAAGDAASRATSVAPEELGSYSRQAVRWIEGGYLTLRPSFGNNGGIYAYRTEIFWDEAGSSLAFRESERIDAAFTQHGLVSVPNQSGHIYLVTNHDGQYRLITVARPTISGEMHGVLLTLQAGPGSHLMPVAAPIALVPAHAVPNAEFGRIGPEHSVYEHYRAYLKRTIDDAFARLLSL